MLIDRKKDGAEREQIKRIFYPVHIDFKRSINLEVYWIGSGMGELHGIAGGVDICSKES